MNKEQFLKELAMYLHNLSDFERKEILQDFEEHFAVGLEKGETEQHIAASLGSPHQIAKEVLATYNLEETQITAKQANPDVARTIMITILLVLFNLIVILGPFMALVGIIFSGWVTGIAFITSPFLYLFKVLVLPSETHLFELFLTIGFVGVGIFVGIAMYYITRFSVQLTIRYVKFNIRIAKGEY